MRFHLPEQKTLVHEVVMPLRWGDMDAMGHHYIDGAMLDEYPNS